MQKRETFVPPSRLYLLFDLCGLADSVSEIVEFRPADLTAANHFYALDIRRMNGEHPFNADIVADSADRERLGQAAALSGDNRTLKDLDALLGALLDANVYRDGVADAEIRNVRLSCA